jgi:hypothetical protein
LTRGGGLSACSARGKRGSAAKAVATGPFPGTTLLKFNAAETAA